MQGPPGTGKSYIGVKIAQLVLSIPHRPSGPILVSDIFSSLLLMYVFDVDFI